MRKQHGPQRTEAMTEAHRKAEWDCHRQWKQRINYFEIRATEIEILVPGKKTREEKDPEKRPALSIVTGICGIGAWR